MNAGAVAGAAQMQTLQAAAAAAQAGAAPQVPIAGLAAVRVRRRVAFGGGTAEWFLRIDGQDVDMLGVGECVDVYVYPGQHRLELRTRFRGTAALVDFAAVDGEVVEFTCRPEEGVTLRRGIIIERSQPVRIVGHPPSSTPYLPR